MKYLLLEVFLFLIENTSLNIIFKLFQPKIQIPQGRTLISLNGSLYFIIDLKGYFGSVNPYGYILLMYLFTYENSLSLFSTVVKKLKIIWINIIIN